MHIVLQLMAMDPSVDFHDQPLAVAVEVHDQAIDHLLTTEVESVELVATQMLPPDPFGVRHLAPERLRFGDLRRANTLSCDDMSGCHRRTSPLAPLRHGEWRTI